jgi:ketosteroid isomerase-like protein
MHRAGLAAVGKPIDFRVESRDVTMDGDYAHAHLVGTVLLKSADTGHEDTMEVRATEVMHRGIDGQWRYVIDHA